MKTKKNPVTGKPFKFHWAVYAARAQMEPSVIWCDGAVAVGRDLSKQFAFPNVDTGGEFA